MLMSAAEIRAEIDRCLGLVEDERFLRVVHSMLDTYIREQETEPVVGYETDGSGISAEELDKQSEQ